MSIRALWPTVMCAAALTTGTLSQGAAAEVAAPFEFSLSEGSTLDVREGGKVRGRLMFAHDTSSPARLNETYKPYLHVFDAEGAAPITKGAGGDFTHHRGIFIGWNKIGFGNKTYDRWHMKGGEQVVQGKLGTTSDAGSATVTAAVNWNDEGGKPIIEETRSMIFRRAPAPAYALIDFVSVIKAPNGDVKLDGDPEHAGIHFRPANEVDKSKTAYVYAGANVDPHKAVDLAWIGETFVLNGKRYSVVQINHPENPSGTRVSAYRNYGRFGMFPTAAIKSGEARAFRYRFLVAEGDMPSAEVIQACANAFTGKSGPAPAITAKPAEQPAPPKANAPKKDAPKTGLK